MGKSATARPLPGNTDEPHPEIIFHPHPTHLPNSAHREVPLCTRQNRKAEGEGCSGSRFGGVLMSSFFLLLQISFRNIFSSFLNVVIGLIILVGTFFFVVGGSLVDSMDKSMSRSIIGSVAGNAQVYQASSKDSPAVFEGWQIPDLDAIPDFSKVKGPLMSHPNVQMVVPEGVNTAIVVYGNTIDQILEKLRKAVSPGTRQPKAVVESLKAHIRQMVSVIQTDMGKVSKIAAQGSFDPLA